MVTVYGALAMRHTLYLICLGAAGLLGAAAQEPAAQLPLSLRSSAPVPDWVDLREIEIPEEIPSHDISAGEYQIDYQMERHIPSDSRFYRSAVWVLDEAGLEENGSRTFTFDPEFQTLRIHWLRILREGKRIDQFNPEELRFFATETDRSLRLLDGSQTALAVLEDLRPGDIVDVAYTYTGVNPALSGEAFLRRRLAYGFPIHRHSYRILAEPDRQLRLQGFLAEDPVDRGLRPDGLREWLLLLENSPPVYSENAIPAEVRVYPELQVSSFDSWGEVADWALRLYPNRAPLPPDVLAARDEIRNTFVLPEKRASEALRFVQSNLRYLGLEMGNGAYQPRPPALVWRRKFGDCKDKALLLTLLLRQLDIEAWPALVHTGWCGGIETFLPSPFAFDHVIVCAAIGDRLYWLDPTRATQIAPLDRLPVEPYGLALVVRSGETGLTPVTDHPLYRNAVEVTQDLTVAPPGEPSRLSVVSRYSGQQAESILSYFRSNSLAETGKNYTEYWESNYAKPELEGPVIMEEETSTGDVVVRESYRIPDAWTPSETDENVHTFQFYPQTVADFLDFPERVDREFPYAMGYPIAIDETIRVQMWTGWEFPDDEVEITGPGLDYGSSSREEAGLITCRYQFTRTVDQVTVDQVADLERAMQEIHTDLGWTLSYDPVRAAAGDLVDVWGSELVLDNSMAFFFIGMGAMLGLISGGIPAFFTTRHGPPLPKPDAIAHLDGIAGWLILPLIGLILTPFRVVFSLVQEDYAWVFNRVQWESITSPDSASHVPGSFWLVAFELIGNGWMILFALCLLVMLLRKRRFFPKLMITYLIISLLILAIDLGAATVLFDMSEEIAMEIGTSIPQVVFSVVWITYFAVSKRVRATFRF